MNKKGRDKSNSINLLDSVICQICQGKRKTKIRYSEPPHAHLGHVVTNWPGQDLTL